MNDSDDAALMRQMEQFQPFSECRNVGDLRRVLQDLPDTTELRAGDGNILYTALAGARDGLVLVLDHD